MAKWFVSIGLCLALLTAPSFAHQQKAAISKLLFNHRSGHLEVMHRFYMHDAEHAAREILGKDADIVGSKETQATFAQYVAERFTLNVHPDPETPLSLLGFEQEGKFFWVYQEMPMPKNIEGLSMQHQALHDIWPEQHNTVNIEGLGDLQTLEFEQNTELLTVKF